MWDVPLVLWSWNKVREVTNQNELQYEKNEWLRPYIEFNRQIRKKAKARGDNFGDVFFKLMKNAFMVRLVKMCITDTIWRRLMM